MTSAFDPSSLSLEAKLEFIRRAELVLALIIRQRIEEARRRRINPEMADAA
jgi:hypothetical protein